MKHYADSESAAAAQAMCIYSFFFFSNNKPLVEPTFDFQRCANAVTAAGEQTGKQQQTSGLMLSEHWVRY